MPNTSPRSGVKIIRKQSAAASLKVLLEGDASEGTPQAAASLSLQRQDVSHLRSFFDFLFHLSRTQSTMEDDDDSALLLMKAKLVGLEESSDIRDFQEVLYSLYTENEESLSWLLIQYIRTLTVDVANCKQQSKPMSTTTLEHKIRRLSLFIRLAHLQNSTADDTCDPQQFNLLDRHHPLWCQLYSAIHFKESKEVRSRKKRKVITLSNKTNKVEATKMNVDQSSASQDDLRQQGSGDSFPVDLNSTTMKQHLMWPPVWQPDLSYLWPCAPLFLPSLNQAPPRTSNNEGGVANCFNLVAGGRSQAADSTEPLVGSCSSMHYPSDQILKSSKQTFSKPLSSDSKPLSSDSWKSSKEGLSLGDYEGTASFNEQQRVKASVVVRPIAQRMVVAADGTCPWLVQLLNSESLSNKQNIHSDTEQHAQAPPASKGLQTSSKQHSQECGAHSDGSNYSSDASRTDMSHGGNERFLFPPCGENITNGLSCPNYASHGPKSFRSPSEQQASASSVEEAQLKSSPLKEQAQLKSSPLKEQPPRKLSPSLSRPPDELEDLRGDQKAFALAHAASEKRRSSGGTRAAVVGGQGHAGISQGGVSPKSDRLARVQKYLAKRRQGRFRVHLKYERRQYAASNRVREKGRFVSSSKETSAIATCQS